jgi:5'-nucleotidase/UDP-sugar diphosphatase
MTNKEKKMTAQKQPGVPPGQHNVKDGETLWDIAQAYYGDGNQRQKIVAANGDITPESLKID